jgi:thioredoxin-like negative regulator of GroEL
MEHLVSQELFETFLGIAPSEKSVPGFIIIWFSARWCGPCRKINESVLLEEVSEVKWYKCDIDENSYTPGFCNVRSIPAFFAIADKKIAGSIQSSDTLQIIEWAKQLLNTYSK